MGSNVQAKQLSLSGKVVLTYTSPSSQKAVEEAVYEINALGNGAAAIACQANLQDLNSPKKIVLETTAAFGDSIDILVNNAGVALPNPLQDITPEEYDNCMNINLRAVLFMTKEVLPHLRRPGRIINISSVGARIGVPNMCVYLASKAGLEGLTRGLAAELGPQGHTVNAVEPGPTKSDLLDKVPGEAQKLQMQLTPLGHRLGEPDDIAPLVAMIAEPQSRWLTGQSISASGGMLMV
ncbi:NAD(P)-binding protein [Neofusicoccum parvum]|nr:NAD(P)-binding protein [Neofusicoccum parvum]